MATVNATSQNISLQNAKNLISQVVNQAVVRPTGNPGLIGASGFLFDIDDDQKALLESAVTDHYVEANYSIQDHIALRPEKIRLRGFIGEVNDVLQQAVQSAIVAINRLQILDYIAPNFTQEASQIYAAVSNALAMASMAVSQAVNIYDLFTQANTTATKQQAAWNYFYSMWKSKQLFTVEAPFGIFENMVIETMHAEQDRHTKMVTGFSVTFKKFNILTETITLTGVLQSQEVSERIENMIA